MQRKSVTSGSPFEAMFGFCRALRGGNTIHVAGTAPIGDDGRTHGVGDAAAQARRCFQIAERGLVELGATLNDVVRTRMFITRLDDQEAVGRVHGEFFEHVRPVATMVVVASLLDPDWRVEIEVEAVLDASDPSAPGTPGRA